MDEAADGVAADPAFAGGGVATAPVGGTAMLGRFAYTLHPDGSHIVAATRANDRSFVVVFLPDGQLDTGFASGGVFALDHPVVVEGVVAHGNGKITLVCNRVDTDRLLLIRLHRDGSGDSQFGFAGIFPVDLDPYEFRGAGRPHLDSSGRLTLSCWVFHTMDAETRAVVLRLNMDGSRDAAFGGGDGLVDVTEFVSLSMVTYPTAPSRTRPDGSGKLLLLSKRFHALDMYLLQSQRLSSGGGVDSTYGGGLASSPEPIYASSMGQALAGWEIIPLADGRVLGFAGADLDGIFGYTRLVWTAWQPDGAPADPPTIGMFDTGLANPIQGVEGRPRPDGRAEVAVLGGQGADAPTRIFGFTPDLDAGTVAVHAFTTPDLRPHTAAWDEQGRLILAGASQDAIALARFLTP